MECLVQMLVFAGYLARFLFVNEPCHKLVVKYLQLKEHIVCDLVHLYLHVDQAESLQALDDLTEH